MKKIFFLLTMLASVAASATITITPLGVDYSTPKVTFKVEWTNTPAAPHNNRVWVWVDLRPVTGTSPGTFTKAVISGATATAGSITTVAGNTRGFYVTTSPSTVTATLSNAPADKFNWCVYGSDAPPNVTAANGTYTLYGSPPFILTAANGTTTQTVAATTIATSAVTIMPVTLTDETGYPGVFCIYTGSDLYIDGTHLCQQRAGGAKNWEAWIQDTRDSEYYRVVLMPDNQWWLAQNVKYAQTGYEITEVSGCTKDKCGRWYSPAQATGTWGGTSGYGANKQGVCPNGWVLPVVQSYNTLFSAISGTASIVAARLRALDATCSGGNDYYGWASAIRLHKKTSPRLGNYNSWMITDNGESSCGAGVDFCGHSCDTCNTISAQADKPCGSDPTVVRCYRQQ